MPDFRLPTSDAVRKYVNDNIITQTSEVRRIRRTGNNTLETNDRVVVIGDGTDIYLPPSNANIGRELTLIREDKGVLIENGSFSEKPTFPAHIHHSANIPSQLVYQRALDTSNGYYGTVKLATGATLQAYVIDLFNRSDTQNIYNITHQFGTNNFSVKMRMRKRHTFTPSITVRVLHYSYDTSTSTWTTGHPIATFTVSNSTFTEYSGSGTVSYRGFANTPTGFGLEITLGDTTNSELYIDDIDIKTTNTSIVNILARVFVWGNDKFKDFPTETRYRTLGDEKVFVFKATPAGWERKRQGEAVNTFALSGGVIDYNTDVAIVGFGNNPSIRLPRITESRNNRTKITIIHTPDLTTNFFSNSLKSVTSFAPSANNITLTNTSTEGEFDGLIRSGTGSRAYLFHSNSNITLEDAGGIRTLNSSAGLTFGGGLGFMRISFELSLAGSSIRRTNGLSFRVYGITSGGVFRELLYLTPSTNKAGYELVEGTFVRSSDFTRYAMGFFHPSSVYDSSLGHTSYTFKVRNIKLIQATAFRISNSRIHSNKLNWLFQKGNIGYQSGTVYNEPYVFRLGEESWELEEREDRVRLGNYVDRIPVHLRDVEIESGEVDLPIIYPYMLGKRLKIRKLPLLSTEMTEKFAVNGDGLSTTLPTIRGIRGLTTNSSVLTAPANRTQGGNGWTLRFASGISIEAHNLYNDSVDLGGVNPSSEGSNAFDFVFEGYIYVGRRSTSNANYAPYAMTRRPSITGNTRTNLNISLLSSFQRVDITDYYKIVKFRLIVKGAYGIYRIGILKYVSTGVSSGDTNDEVHVSGLSVRKINIPLNLINKNQSNDSLLTNDYSSGILRQMDLYHDNETVELEATRAGWALVGGNTHYVNLIKNKVQKLDYNVITNADNESNTDGSLVIRPESIQDRYILESGVNVRLPNAEECRGKRIEFRHSYLSSKAVEFGVSSGNWGVSHNASIIYTATRVTTGYAPSNLRLGAFSAAVTFNPSSSIDAMMNFTGGYFSSNTSVIAGASNQYDEYMVGLWVYVPSALLSTHRQSMAFAIRLTNGSTITYRHFTLDNIDTDRWVKITLPVNIKVGSNNLDNFEMFMIKRRGTGTANHAIYLETPFIHRVNPTTITGEYFRGGINSFELRLPEDYFIVESQELRTSQNITAEWVLVGGQSSRVKIIGKTLANATDFNTTASEYAKSIRRFDGTAIEEGKIDVPTNAHLSYMTHTYLNQFSPFHPVLLNGTANSVDVTNKNYVVFSQLDTSYNRMFTYSMTNAISREVHYNASGRWY